MKLSAQNIIDLGENNNDDINIYIFDLYIYTKYLYHTFIFLNIFISYSSQCGRRAAKILCSLEETIHCYSN